MSGATDLPDDNDALKAMIALQSKEIERHLSELRGRDLLIEKLRFQLTGQLRHPISETRLFSFTTICSRQAELIRVNANVLTIFTLSVFADHI